VSSEILGPDAHLFGSVRVLIEELRSWSDHVSKSSLDGSTEKLTDEAEVIADVCRLKIEPRDELQSMCEDMPLRGEPLLM
jgi:hypothetical protein